MWRRDGAVKRFMKDRIILEQLEERIVLDGAVDAPPGYEAPEEAAADPDPGNPLFDRDIHNTDPGRWFIYFNDTGYWWMDGDWRYGFDFENGQWWENYGGWEALGTKGDFSSFADDAVCVFDGDTYDMPGGVFGVVTETDFQYDHTTAVGTYTLETGDLFTYDYDTGQWQRDYGSGWEVFGSEGSRSTYMFDGGIYWDDDVPFSYVKDYDGSFWWTNNAWEYTYNHELNVMAVWDYGDNWWRWLSDQGGCSQFVYDGEWNMLPDGRFVQYANDMLTFWYAGDYQWRYDYTADQWEQYDGGGAWTAKAAIPIADTDTTVVPADSAVFNDVMYIAGHNGLWDFGLYKYENDQVTLVFDFELASGATYEDMNCLFVYDGSLWFTGDDNGDVVYDLYEIQSDWTYTEEASLDTGDGRYPTARGAVVQGNLLYLIMGTFTYDGWLYTYDFDTDTLAPLADITTVAGDWYMSDLTDYNGDLYWLGTDSTDTLQSALFRYNSGSGLPELVTSVPYSAWPQPSPGWLTSFRDGLFFCAYTDTEGYEVWSWNPTDGAALYKDLLPGGDDPDPSGLSVYDGGLYFFADLGDGKDLYEFYMGVQLNTPPIV